MPERWDIFCKVVDNYGDAGVCWRLARELCSEHAIAVTLWLDDLATLARFVPGVDASLDEQSIDAIRVRRWAGAIDIAACADVVVEAFGCSLPDDYVAAMAQRPIAPRWFVLEYLSAETWIDDAHGLPSPHPRLPLVRRYWFPGFTARSGGLLRERGLVEARTAFTRDDAAPRALWSSLGLPAPASGEIRVSLFCYPNGALPALLDAWTASPVPVGCVVPEGVAADALAQWSGAAVSRGMRCTRGALEVYVIPFVPQDRYDRLLWACDVNFVRGEDSFVRAQWAARPLVWHAYPQAEGAHRRKLEAFVDRYAADLDPGAAGALRLLLRAWNDDAEAAGIADAWSACAATLPALARHAEAWAGSLARLPELAAGLVKASNLTV